MDRTTPPRDIDSMPNLVAYISFARMCPAVIRYSFSIYPHAVTHSDSTHVTHTTPGYSCRLDINMTLHKTASDIKSIEYSTVIARSTFMHSCNEASISITWPLMSALLLFISTSTINPKILQKRIFLHKHISDVSMFVSYHATPVEIFVAANG